MAQINISPINYVGIQAAEITSLLTLEALPIADMVEVHEDVRYKKQLALARAGKYGWRKDTTCAKTNTGGQIETEERFIEVTRIYAQNDQCVNDYFQKFIIEQVKNGSESGDLTGVRAAEQVTEMWARDRSLDLQRVLWGGNTAAVAGDFTGSDAATKAAFYSMFDGWLKRIFDAVTAGDINQAYTFSAAPTPTTAIAALRALFEAQSAALRGVARDFKIIAVDTDIYDQFLTNRESFTGSDLSYRLLEDGTERLTFRGIEVREMPIWLQMRSEGSYGAYLPTSVGMLMTRDALHVGTDAYSNETQIQAWYSIDDDKNYVRAKAPYGTQIADDEAIVVCGTAVPGSGSGS